MATTDSMIVLLTGLSIIHMMPGILITPEACQVSRQLSQDP